MSSDKPFNSGQWSKARFHSFIKGGLRSLSVKWPPRYECLNEAKTVKKINSKTGRLAQHYRCNSCKQEFPGKEMQVNHIVPVIPTSGFVSWDSVVERMFCEKIGLEALCIPCHKTITKEENDERKSISRI